MAAKDRHRIFSIVADVSETRVCNAAVASKFPSAGRFVPYVRGDWSFFPRSTITYRNEANRHLTC